MHRVAALIIASAVAITSAHAQTPTELRISGTVEKLDGDLLALSLSQGISIVVRLDSEPRVNSVAKGSGSDLKAGSQVSAQVKSGQSGDLIATQIVLFVPGSAVRAARAIHIAVSGSMVIFRSSPLTATVRTDRSGEAFVSLIVVRSCASSGPGTADPAENKTIWVAMRSPL